MKSSPYNSQVSSPNKSTIAVIDLSRQITAQLSNASLYILNIMDNSVRYLIESNTFFRILCSSDRPLRTYGHTDIRTYGHTKMSLKKLNIEAAKDSTTIAQELNDKLVQIRKGEGEFKGMDESEKVRRAQAAMKDILNVETAAALKTKILGMAQDFNVAVRSQVQELSSSADPGTSKKYFANIH
jgi:hypothetical protein